MRGGAVAQDTAGRVIARKKKNADLLRYHCFERDIHLSDRPATIFCHVIFNCKVDHGFAFFKLGVLFSAL